MDSQGYRRQMTSTLAVALVALFVVAGCGAPAEPQPATQEAAPTSGDASGTHLSSEPSTAAVEADEVHVLAVGDIADCDVRTDEAVARLIAERRGKILTLGDTAYPSGAPEDFSKCFDPKWGPLVPRMFPSVGNHEYQTDGAAGYFDYFKARGRPVGNRDEGWRAFDLGTSWRAIVLNSNCDQVGGCTAESPQGKWLAAELEANGDRNVLAYWHAPRYSSGDHGSSRDYKPFFRMLWEARADLVLNGHDHDYERFAPQNAAGDYRVNGVQEFVVGTGGRGLYAFEDPRLPNTRVRNDKTHGVLKLRLRPDGYAWRFLPAAGGTFTDSGSRTLN